MNRKNSDIDLIDGLKKGTQQACTLLYEEYYSALFYFASKIISDQEEAQDIVLTTFTKFWNLRGNFDTNENIKAFLYITARNHCLDFLRYRKKLTIRNKEYASYINSVEEDPELAKIESEVLRRIYAEINQLPEQCRKVAKLSYFKGLTTAEIAAQLNISPKTVGNQRRRAIELLRSVIKLSDLIN